MNLVGIPVLLAVFLSGAFMLCLPRRRKIGAVILIGAIGFTSTRLAAEGGWKKKFDSFPDGVSEREVHDALWWSSFDFEDGKSPLGYSLRDRDPRVIKEIWCVEFFFPGQYAFGFDTAGNLVSRYHYQSP